MLNKTIQQTTILLCEIFFFLSFISVEIFLKKVATENGRKNVYDDDGDDGIGDHELWSKTM